MKSSIKIGDCFEIPLVDGRYAYGQYIFLDDRQPTGLGTLVQIFDVLSDRPLEHAELRRLVEHKRLMFPPVFIGLIPAIRTGRWKIIMHSSPSKFTFPKFRSTLGTKPGIYHDWKIWDGKETVFVGKLPPEYRSLELKMVWGAEGLEDRIIEGKYRGNDML